MLSLIRTATITAVFVSAPVLLATTPGPGAGQSVVKTSATNACRASLTVADARALALQTPNARAFVQNLNATLKTEVLGRNADGTVNIRVVNTANNNETVDVYTIDLRNGHIIDDAEEPAGDAQTAAFRDKLIARHCAGR